MARRTLGAIDISSVATFLICQIVIAVSVVAYLVIGNMLSVYANCACNHVFVNSNRGHSAKMPDRRVARLPGLALPLAPARLASPEFCFSRLGLCDWLSHSLSTHTHHHHLHLNLQYLTYSVCNFDLTSLGPMYLQ